MADLDMTPRTAPQTPHDGAAACRLCPTAMPHADEDWCAAAGCLVCDECCRRLVHGDPARLSALQLENGEPMTLEVLYMACATCGRGRHRFAEHLLDTIVGQEPVC